MKTEQLEFPFDAPAPAVDKPPALSPSPPVAAALELPSDPQARGYHRFRSEQEQAIKQLETRFGLILNTPVRLTLIDIPDEFTGKVLLTSLFPEKQGPRGLRLRIGTTEFDAADIESCVVIRS